MGRKMHKDISVFEFGCEAPLRFFEHCAACPRFDDPCPDLILGKEVLRGKKKMAYGNLNEENTVRVTDFKCLTPLYYFEHSRKQCGHAGRCREEGLLLALLDGKKGLDYSRKEVAELAPLLRRSKAGRAAKVKVAKATAIS